MKIFFFIAMVLIELIFVILRLVSRKSYTKTRAVVRVAVGLLFAVGILTKWISWNMLTLLPAVFIFILAAIGIIQLIRNAKDDQPIKPLKSILIGTGLILVLVAVFAPWVLINPDLAVKPTGTYPVTSTLFSITDENRIDPYGKNDQKRKMNVECWYPETKLDETFPLIVFSHGMNGVRSSNFSLYLELGSHGYVTCSIDHLYHAMFSADPKNEITIISPKFQAQMKEMYETQASDRVASLNVIREMMKVRTDDINFVIDTLLKQTELQPIVAVQKMIDPEKIGLMGHSFGASAVLAVGRQRQDIRAVVELEAPFFGDIQRIEDNHYIWNETPYPLPLLNVYSDDTWGKMAEDDLYAENQRYIDEKYPDVFNAYLMGSNHFSLTDLALNIPLIASMSSKWTTDPLVTLTDLNRITLPFFDAYLKQTGSFQLPPELEYSAQ